MDHSAISLDVLEFWVADLAQTQELLRTKFGFVPVEVDVDTGPGGEAVCLGCGDVALVVRQGGSPSSAVARHVAVHGDTVADLALVCRDPGAIAERARAYGLEVTIEPGRTKIDVTGDATICHSLRRRKLIDAPIPAPGVVPMGPVDHVTYCLQSGTAESVARVYEDVFGLERVDTSAIGHVGGDVMGMRSIVLRSAASLTVVLTEPAGEGGSSQTQRFVDTHVGPGVQHAALAYDDIGVAVASLRARGVEFLPAPPRYYLESEERLADAAIAWDAIRPLDILVDADDDGLLFQLFTRPIFDRGTFFFELIQRSGATGFGANNVRALFAAVDAAAHEQPPREDAV